MPFSAMKLQLASGTRNKAAQERGQSCAAARRVAPLTGIIRL